MGKLRQEYASYCANGPTCQGLKTVRSQCHLLGEEGGEFFAPQGPSGTQAASVFSTWFPRAWRALLAVETGFKPRSSDSRVCVLNRCEK